MTLLIGQTIGRYTIEALAGTGPLVSNYQGVDNNLERRVIVQVIHPQLAPEPAFSENFARIARAAVRIDHPGLARLLDFGQSAPYHYLITELVDGPSLAQLLSDMRKSGQWLPLTEAIELIQRIGAAMEVAHLHKLAYALVTPATIKFKPDRYQAKENAHRPVITELGVFHQTIVESGQASAPYGDEKVVAGAIRSLGLLLYELSTGHAFDGALSAAKVDEALGELGRLYPQLPHAIVTVLNRALSTTQHDPFTSIHAFMQVLDLPRPASHYGIVSLSDQYVQSSMQGPILEVDLFPSVTIQQSIPPMPVATPNPPPPVVEIPPVPPQHEDVSVSTILQIEAPGGEVHTVMLSTEGLMVGRSQDTDVVINDLRASRRHARIDYDGTSYLVTDQGSLNGTFIDEARLQARTPHIWRANQTVRIGSHKLRLIPQSSTASQTIRIPASVPPPPMTVWIRDLEEEVPREKIVTTPENKGWGIYRPEIQQELEPGSSLDVPIFLLNLGSGVESLSLDFEGLPPPWLQLPADRVKLQTEEQKKLIITISPPRVPLTRAGRYRLTVKITNQQQPQSPLVAQIDLKILPYYDFLWEIEPEQGIIGEPIKVTIQNRGNAVGTFQLMWWNPENELEFEPQTAELKVQPGISNSVDFRASGRSRRWIGGARRYKVSIQIAPDAGAVDLREIEVLDRSRIGF